MLDVLPTAIKVLGDCAGQWGRPRRCGVIFDRLTRESVGIAMIETQTHVLVPGQSNGCATSVTNKIKENPHVTRSRTQVGEYVLIYLV
jgi:hypothetical protein